MGSSKFFVKNIVLVILLIHFNTVIINSQNTQNISIDFSTFYAKTHVFNSDPRSVLRPDAGLFSFSIGTSYQFPIYKGMTGNISVGYARPGGRIVVLEGGKRYHDGIYLEVGPKYYFNKNMFGMIGLGYQYSISVPNDVARDLYKRRLGYFKARMGYSFLKYFEVYGYLQPFLDPYLELQKSEATWEIYGVGLSVKLFTK